MTPDPFGTAGIRERVLDGWAAAAVRFREDANAEEDLALGGYRDRVVVELAQNAADAAVRAGVRGRLLLALRDLPEGPVLVAANTGAALDADGVQALATLRASAKRDHARGTGTVGGAAGTVGRFGVGFSAVLAVSEEPVVLSRAGGVRFSAGDTRALVAEAGRHAPDLAAELVRREGHVPVLRLPFEADGEPPAGYDTAVLLPLRDAAAEDLVVRLLADLDDSLLLALPGLDEVVVEGPPAVRPRTLADVGERWHVLHRRGKLDPALLADRPTEERGRTTWSLTWALPARDGVAVPAVLHAPTPTDEPLPWRALLIGSFPLDPDRRSVAPGPATDALVGHAARAYAELVAQEAAGGADVWSLVPVGLAAGRVDGALREAALAVLATTPVLPPAEPVEPDEPGLLRPRDAVVLDLPTGGDAAAVAALAPSVAGLVLAPRQARAAVEALGVTTLPLADLVEQLPLGRPAAAWRVLYAALSGPAVDPLVREALAALPVPLADGRVVRGVRGCVLPPADPAVAAALADLGVRVVDVDAVHPLLERLGGAAVDAAGALGLPEVQAFVAASLERVEDGDDDANAQVDAVLTLVAAALRTGATPDATPTLATPTLATQALATLALADHEGEPAPARELVLPGSTAADLFDPEVLPPVDPDLVDRWGADVLQAVGVLTAPALVRAHDVGLLAGDVPDELADLPDWDDWVEACLRVAGEDALDVTCPEVLAVRDLDAVAEGAWPSVLAALSADRELRRALTEPALLTVRTPGGVLALSFLSYTTWWLRRELFGDRMWAAPHADARVVALLGEPASPVPGLDPAGLVRLVERLDPVLRIVLGGTTTLERLDPGAVPVVLARLADAAVEVDVPTALAAWVGLAGAALRSPAGVETVQPPARVRALLVRDGVAVGTQVVEAADAVVVDGPAWLQRTDLGAPVVVPGVAATALAELLDLPSADEVAAGGVDETGSARVPVPEAVRALLPGVPATWCEHDTLTVDGQDVDWWVDGRDAGAGSGSEDGGSVVHAATVDGLARGLAWAAGRWERRFAVAELLTEPDRAAALLLEAAFEDAPPAG